MTVGELVPTVDCHGSVENHADKIFEAISQVGFVYLLNSGIDNDGISELFDASRGYFSASEAVKSLDARPPDGYDKGCNSGYVAPGVETLDPKLKKFEIREAFNITPSDGDNVKYPKTMSKDLYEAFTTSCRDLSHKLLTLLGRKLQIDDPTAFTSAHTSLFTPSSIPNATTIRLLHYRPVSDDLPAATPRCGEHSDYGSITLLFQDGTGGLEVMNTHGQFVPASPVPNAVLVNTGDMMEIWSNGRIKAVKHRVLTPQTGDPRRSRHRYSVAYFVHPDDEHLARPLLPGQEGGRVYEPITARQHLLNMFSKTYG